MNNKENENLNKELEANVQLIKFEGLELLKEALNKNKITLAKSRRLMFLINDINDFWEGDTLIKALRIIFFNKLKGE